MGRKSFWHVENRLAREVVVENHSRTLGRKSIQAVEKCLKIHFWVEFYLVEKGHLAGIRGAFHPPYNPRGR